MENESDLTQQDNLESQTPEPAETPDNVEAPDTPETESEKPSFDDPLEPEQLKNLTPEQLEEKRKAFHADYTRKTQRYAEQQREWETQKATLDHELKSLRSQFSQLQNLATEVLKDPKKLDAYRQVYGPQLGVQQTTPENIPQFETTEQLVQWINQREQNLKEQLRTELRQENQTFQQKQTELVRWERAVQEMNQDEFFQRHQKAIAALAKDPIFGLDAQYKAGRLDEAGVLREAMGRYKELLEPELKRVRDEALGTQQKKRSATTARPSRPVPTERTEPLSDAELLARIQSKVG